MRNPHRLKVRRYASRLIDLKEYLDSFPGGKLADTIGMMELNDFLLNSMPNSWSKQAYGQGFDCESITFKEAVNMFKHMDISEPIYVGVVEPSYKKLRSQMPTVLVIAG